MSKHTPGPWKAIEDIDGDCNIKSGDWYIAIICGGVGRHEQEDATKANAALIAAAPDLLAAAQKFATLYGYAQVTRGLNHQEDDDYIPCSMRMDDLKAIAEAVAKAEGK